MSLDVDDIFTGLPKLVGAALHGNPMQHQFVTVERVLPKQQRVFHKIHFCGAGHSRVLMKELVRVDQRGSHDAVFANVDDDSGDGSGVSAAGSSAAGENVTQAAVDTKYLTCHKIILRLQQPGGE